MCGSLAPVSRPFHLAYQSTTCDLEVTHEVVVHVLIHRFELVDFTESGGPFKLLGRLYFMTTSKAFYNSLISSLI